MVASVNTGVPLQGGVVNAPGQERQSVNTFFNALSTSAISHIFSVDENPYYLKAFGLTNVGFVIVLMISNTPTGELQEPMMVNSRSVGLTKNQNFLLIDFPGVYRLQMVDDLGVATVVGGSTALSYWSWGLKAFGTATLPSG